jgi:hypothetical protein
MQFRHKALRKRCVCMWDFKPAFIVRFEALTVTESPDR